MESRGAASERTGAGAEVAPSGAAGAAGAVAAVELGGEVAAALFDREGFAFCGDVSPRLGAGDV